MATYAIQRRRGTATEHSSFTGLAGELTVNTTRNSVHVHDGSQAGGHELAKVDLSNLGTTSIGTHLLPSANVTYDLGSSSAMWRDLYVGPGTLFINNVAVAGIEAGDVTISGDTDENIVIKALGSGDIELTPASGVIQAKGTLSILAGKNISSSDGNAIAIADDIDLSGNTLTNVADPTDDAHVGDRLFNDGRYLKDGGTQTISGDKTFSGDVQVANLTVTGTTTTVNTTDLEVKDRLIKLNSGESGNGVTSNTSGLIIDRGSAADVTFRFNDDGDKWQVTEDGTDFYSLFHTNDADSANTASKLVQRDASGNFAANVATLTATAARYADLAERYEADKKYDAGTVMIIGGDKEVMSSKEKCDHRVIGIVSTAPAVMMNSDAGNDDTHPYIAIAGRVPCKVVGPVYKGDILMTSDEEGHAKKADGKPCGEMIGKALEDHDVAEGTKGVIEVFVNLM
tara:strand:- start:2096 stop:3463 length:1368 start_codon:yes stop_codon:yes gene_type:complete